MMAKIEPSIETKEFFKNFHFEQNGCMTLADAVFAYVKDEIAFGRLKPGTLLPTIKELAAGSGLTFRVARGVTERLVKEGYVHSRPRVGTVVLPREVTTLRGRVLFAMPDVDAGSYHVMHVVDALRRRLTMEGFVFTVVTFSQDNRDNLTFLKHELSHTPDLIIAMYSAPHVRTCLSKAGARCIYLYGDAPKRNEGPWIRFSAKEAIACLVDHCTRSGIKSVVEVRFEGNECPDARADLANAGIESRMKVVPRLDGLGRYEGIERSSYVTFLNMPRTEFPELFVFWDDFVGQGALTAFLKRHIRIPEDVRVVSLSNKGLGPVYSEPLTRFECDPSETGLKVADFALAVFAKGRLPPVPVITPQYVFGHTFPY